ncbi:MAG: hypothetical protein Q4C64_01255 [Erysipelotrichia bacterium]|nr:hypothetical protein [Erysipelotrichia bacterium]
MKKLFTLLLVVCMMLSFTGCQKESDKEAEYKLGMGVVTSLESSKDGQAQVDATVAAVVVDAEGKIVACKIDVAQNKVPTTDGVIDLTQEFKTKMELGDDYNMVKYSEATKEWYEQANNFANYCVGKTAEEVKNTETKSRDDGLHEGYIVAADPELFAQCSMQITDFIEAVVKACNDEQASSFKTAGEFKLGVAANSEINEGNTKDATEEEDGVVAIYSEFAATVVDADGKILAAVIDEIQPKVHFDVDGAITEKEFKATKRELKEDYNMVKYSEATKEWYEQAKNFADYCVGKTADEVLAIETKVRADGLHDGYVVAADETLFASCSIQITGMMAVVAEAANYAVKPLH